MVRAVVALLCVGAVAAAPGASALASTPAEMVAALNKQRKANGLGKVTLNPDLSEGCSKHVLYMEQNGFGHGEEEGKPGYTEAGAARGRYAFEEENIYGSPFTWTASSNAFARLSYHLRAHFDPRLSEVGYAESSMYSCVRFLFAHRDRRGYFFAADPRGPREVYTGGVLGDGESEDAGMPRGADTGPALLLYHLGKGARLEPVSYWLKGPRGGELRVSLLSEDGGGPHVDVSTMLPHERLKARTKYHGQVRWRLEDGTVETQRFSFRTTGRPNQIISAGPSGDRLFVSSLARNITVVLKSGKDRIRKSKRARRRSPYFHEGQRLWEAGFRLRRARGRAWNVCVTSGGRGTPYERMTACIDWEFP